MDSQWRKQEACFASATQVWFGVNHNTSVTSGEWIRCSKRIARASDLVSYTRLWTVTKSNYSLILRKCKYYWILAVHVCTETLALLVWRWRLRKTIFAGAWTSLSSISLAHQFVLHTPIFLNRLILIRTRAHQISPTPPPPTHTHKKKLPMKFMTVYFCISVSIVIDTLITPIVYWYIQPRKYQLSKSIFQEIKFDGIVVWYTHWWQ